MKCFTRLGFFHKILSDQESTKTILFEELNVSNRTDPAFGNFDLTGRNAFCHSQAPLNVYLKSFQVAVVDAYQFRFIANMFQLFFGWCSEEPREPPPPPACEASADC